MAKKIIILGAGMMGSALAFPAAENGNEVHIVGTCLDDSPCDRGLSLSTCVYALYGIHLTLEPRNLATAPRVVYLPVIFFIACSSTAISESANCLGTPTKTWSLL